MAEVVKGDDMAAPGGDAAAGEKPAAGEAPGTSSSRQPEPITGADNAAKLAPEPQTEKDALPAELKPEQEKSAEVDEAAATKTEKEKEEKKAEEEEKADEIEDEKERARLARTATVTATIRGPSCPCGTLWPSLGSASMPATGILPSHSSSRPRRMR